MKTVKILVIDQGDFLQSHVASILQQSLGSTEIEMIQCHSYWEAFGRLFSSRWDLVMISSSLSGKGGLETARHIRAFLSCPVIVFTHDGMSIKTENILAHATLQEDDARVYAPRELNQLMTGIVTHTRSTSPST